MPEYNLNMRRVFSALSIFALLFAVASASVQAATTAPSVEGETASSITSDGATLEAEVDPGSAGAYYQFQLSEHPSEFADEIFCPTSPQSKPPLPCVGPESAAALPIGLVSHAEGQTTVKLDLAGAGVTLKPGTTYYFRLVAASAVQSEDTIEWEQPVVPGGTKSFTTLTSTSVSGPESSSSSGSGSAAGDSSGITAPAPLRRRHRHRHHHHRRRYHGSPAVAQAAALRIL